ncbi:response regulator transcription factor [Nocardioides sp. Y6]|uniref:Response regulator transcription factor n=1 Tax=Nocardioides malaquae TaxID=2773426 RepID=A0ABR9RWF7_9ACTN|nr:response regulator transcription factor [Nocardioides malaquae]MBE7325889.1 response regulator transcription factor [Nocardioides malaquae]
MKLFRKKTDEPAEVEVEAPAPLTEPEPVVIRHLRGHQVAAVIVDDDDEVRFVLRVALESAGFRVAGDAGDAESAMELIKATQPDIVVLDLHMPEIGGLEILPLIYEDCPTTKVVVCSAISATYMTEAALQEGAWAYIVKGVSARTIADHLIQVAEGGAVRPVRPYPLVKDFGTTALES